MPVQLFPSVGTGATYAPAPLVRGGGYTTANVVADIQTVFTGLIALGGSPTIAFVETYTVTTTTFLVYSIQFSASTRDTAYLRISVDGTGTITIGSAAADSWNTGPHAPVAPSVISTAITLGHLNTSQISFQGVKSAEIVGVFVQDASALSLQSLACIRPANLFADNNPASDVCFCALGTLSAGGFPFNIPGPNMQGASQQTGIIDSSGLSALQPRTGAPAISNGLRIGFSNARTALGLFSADLVFLASGTLGVPYSVFQPPGGTARYMLLSYGAGNSAAAIGVTIN